MRQPAHSKTAIHVSCTPQTCINAATEHVMSTMSTQAETETGLASLVSHSFLVLFRFAVFRLLLTEPTKDMC
jgi:hypothetical protein